MKIKLTTRNNWFLFLRPHSVNRSKGQFERKTFLNYLKTFKTQKSQKNIAVRDWQVSWFCYNIQFASRPVGPGGGRRQLGVVKFCDILEFILFHRGRNIVADGELWELQDICTTLHQTNDSVHT